MNTKNIECLNILIIDFEATCCNHNTIPRSKTEIIEIGAIIVDINKPKKIIAEFQTFIKPIIHPNLTDFCTALTSIQQFDVDSAPLFNQAIVQFEDWFKIFSIAIWGSWGGYDFRQLQRECKRQNIKNPLMHIPHLNLKELFAKQQHLNKQLGLGEALEYSKVTFEGIPHRGIDDAKNIAKLLPYITI